MPRKTYTYVWLRWLKPVSSLSSNALIRRIGTTTLYHVLATLWSQMEHGLLLNKMQLLLWRNTSPWQWASHVNTPFILSLVASISKSNLVTAIFLFMRSNQKGKMKLSAKFKKICTADWEPPYFCDFFKVALILQYRIFLNVAESFILAFWWLFSNKRGGHRVRSWDMSN